MPGQIVADTARMASDHALVRFREPGGHVRADGKHPAQQARSDPLADTLKAIVAAKHVAHLDDQLTLLGQRNHSLPLRPVRAGRLIVPDMLAGPDDLLGLVEALVV